MRLAPVALVIAATTGGCLLAPVGLPATLALAPTPAAYDVLGTMSPPSFSSDGDDDAADREPPRAKTYTPEELHQAARRASALGYCDAVRATGPRIARRSWAYHDYVYLADEVILRCLDDR
jgi:hypothetical protein